jgi:putative tributyrin esterase
MKPVVHPGRFSPVEISESMLEHEHLRHLTMFSPALRGRGNVSLFVPPGIERSPRIPVVLLLHGVYGSHWSWFLKGAAHRTTQALIREGRIRPMLIVTPSDGMRGDGTGYLPGPDMDFERWICEDVVGLIAHMFSQVSTDFLLAGLSMGGYGALRLGAKYPQQFRAISAHSAITAAAQFSQFVRDMSAIEAVDEHDRDPLYWLDRHRTQLPPLRLDCGLEDALLENNRELHRALTEKAIPHTFEIFPGGHDWGYWQQHLADSLLFFEKVLRESQRRQP